VSIGTVEVTVVSPAPPTQAAPTWPRPARQPAEGAGTGRLRDALRRWYGIAQG
jgi:hypothetical protein